MPLCLTPRRTGGARGGSRARRGWAVVAQTIATEFCVKVVPVPETDASVELYLYDTAGQSMLYQRDWGTLTVRAGAGNLA